MFTITMSGSILSFPDQMESEGDKMRISLALEIGFVLLFAVGASAQVRAYVQMDFSGPIEFVVTDSQGERSGINPITKTDYDEISYADYGDGTDEGMREFVFRHALTDTSFSTVYSIQIFGTGDGLFTGGGNGKQTRSGKGGSFRVSGVIDSNQTLNYVFNYSTDSTIAPVFTKVIESITIGQEVGDLLKLSLITNHGIANSLQQKIDNAWKQKEKGQTNAARNLVRAFINEVNAQNGKAITGEAASILLADAQQLLEEWSQ